MGLTGDRYIVAARPRAVELDVADRVLRAGADGEGLARRAFGGRLERGVAPAAAATEALATDGEGLAGLSAGGASAPPLSPRRRSWGGTILEGAPDVGAEGLDEVEGAVAAGAGGAGFGGGPSAPGINAGSGAFSHKPWSPAAELLEGAVAGWAE